MSERQQLIAMLDRCQIKWHEPRPGEIRIGGELAGKCAPCSLMAFPGASASFWFDNEDGRMVHVSLLKDGRHE